MGRTVPSFRNVIASEKKESKPFRDALDKKERKEFDEMWDIPKLFIAACSNSCQLVPLQPIVISILFHHYKQLRKCRREVEEMETNVKTSKNTGLTKKDEKEERADDLLKPSSASLSPTPPQLH